MREALSGIDVCVANHDVVPDGKELIAQKLIMWADEDKVDVIITTGGTGLSPRGVTPEATLSVVNKVVPGFAETVRAGTLKKTPMAMLSRAVVGTRESCLIVNLLGSPKAVRECLEPILPVLPHAVETLKGQGSECATAET